MFLWQNCMKSLYIEGEGTSCAGWLYSHELRVVICGAINFLISQSYVRDSGHVIMEEDITQLIIFLALHLGGFSSQWSHATFLGKVGVRSWRNPSADKRIS